MRQRRSGRIVDPEGRHELRGAPGREEHMEDISSLEAPGVVFEDAASADLRPAGCPDDEGEAFIYEESHGE